MNKHIIITIILVFLTGIYNIGCNLAKIDKSTKDTKGGSIENYPECNEKLASAFILYSGLEGQTPLSETVKKLNKRYDVNCKFISGEKIYNTSYVYNNPVPISTRG